MRAMITLLPEAEDLVRREMKQSASSLDSVINQAIIDSLSAGTSRSFRTRTRPLGTRLPSDSALTLASQLDDVEFTMKRA